MFGSLASDEPPEEAPLGGSRVEAVQRLQVGLTGLCAMILLIGLAGLIGGQADIAEEAAVPDAAPTTEPTAAPPQRDPLADAGVVPDIPSDAEDTQGASRQDAAPPHSDPARSRGNDIEKRRGRIVPDTPAAGPGGPADAP
ncbi:MAG: hypothetical protein V2J14_10995 [Erythrobacter sp.]|nr:hypothetical protein [Erythrobacter sp.]